MSRYQNKFYIVSTHRFRNQNSFFLFQEICFLAQDHTQWRTWNLVVEKNCLTMMRIQKMWTLDDEEDCLVQWDCHRSSDLACCHERSCLCFLVDNLVPWTRPGSRSPPRRHWCWSLGCPWSVCWSLIDQRMLSPDGTWQLEQSVGSVSCWCLSRGRCKMIQIHCWSHHCWAAVLSPSSLLDLQTWSPSFLLFFTLHSDDDRVSRIKRIFAVLLLQLSFTFYLLLFGLRCYYCWRQEFKFNIFEPGVTWRTKLALNRIVLRWHLLTSEVLGWGVKMNWSWLDDNWRITGKTWKWDGECRILVQLRWCVMAGWLDSVSLFHCIA